MLISALNKILINILTANTPRTTIPWYFLNVLPYALPAHVLISGVPIMNSYKNSLINSTALK